MVEVVLGWYPRKEETSALCLHRSPSLCVRRPEILLQTLIGPKGGPSVSHYRWVARRPESALVSDQGRKGLSSSACQA